MNRTARVIIGLVLAVVLVWLLFTWVFPWVEMQFLVDPTLG